MVYAGKIIKDLGLEGDYTLMVVASVQEEDCEGRNWQYIINEDKIIPECVIFGEPSNDRIFNAQKGRMEISIHTKGKSSHICKSFQCRDRIIPVKLYVLKPGSFEKTFR